MTMTSGVGTPFFMAPEMATGTKHYTGAVDVYSFAIMAAQVMVGRLVYDGQNDFDTSYGLCFPNCLSHNTKPKSHTVCVCFVFSLCLLFVVMDCQNTHTAFVNAVCQGLRPRVSGCSADMKTLMTACWDANPSSRPCLSSFLPLLFHVLTFSFLVLFSLLSPFLPSTHQHLMPLLPLSVLSIDSPCTPSVMHHHKHPHSLFLKYNEVLCASASVCLVCCVPSTLSP